MAKLRALKRFTYNRKLMKPGDVFEAHAPFVRPLVLLKRAEHYVEPTPPAPAPEPVAAQAPRRRTMTRAMAPAVEAPVEQASVEVAAEPAPEPAAEPPPVADDKDSRGTYTRRDLRAEE